MYIKIALLMSNSQYLHSITKEIESLLNKDNQLMEKWGALSALAQNEWICYTTIPKQEETKKKRLKRLEEDILLGKKRPCCWPGCPHRNKSTMKYFS